MIIKAGTLIKRYERELWITLEDIKCNMSSGYNFKNYIEVRVCPLNSKTKFHKFSTLHNQGKIGIYLHEIIS